MAEIVKRVAIELGGATRHLVYDFNALASMEEASGREFGELFEELLLSTRGVRVDAEDGESRIIPRLPKASLVRLMIWAGLLADEPNLTVKDVGAWLTTNNLAVVINKVSDAFGINAPEGEPKEANPPAAPSETPPVADAA